MGKLVLIDSENFILEGEFEKIKSSGKTVIDENSVKKAIELYKNNFVTPGLALGELSEGFLTMPTVDGDQVVDEKRDAAFMVVDIWWKPESRAIYGKIIILNSQDGIKIKEASMQGADCYMSSSETDSYPIKDEKSSQILLRISEIKNYKISIMDFHNMG